MDTSPVLGDGMPPLLELDSISKSYGSVRALRAASLSLSAGEVVCLVGENGAGKSTLSAVASGLIQPDTGSIRLDGERVEFSTPADAERAGVCIAPQELILCGNLTVAENVMLGAFPHGKLNLLRRAEMLEQADARLTRLGLGHIDLRREVGSLSVVERAFVQLARAMRDDARVLITDEPTAPMSGAEADRLLTLLESIRGHGVGVVFVSHRLDEVLRLGDRCVVLRDGQVVADFPSGQGTRQHLLDAMLGGKDLGGDHHPPPPMDGTPALRVQGVGTLSGLVDVSLDVHPGHIVGVYGIAGSGREELGQVLFGAAPRQAGVVAVDGREVPGGSIQRAIEHGLGYVPAERRSQGLVFERSIRENISVASLRGMSTLGFVDSRRERAAAERWTAQLSIKARDSDSKVSTLSGGNQQKVLLARWIAAGGRVLILDDPTRGVDLGSRADIYATLRELADQHGVAILVISSDVEEVATLCRHVYVMRKGRVAVVLHEASQEQIAHAAYREEAQ
jgi:ABC-type sugar transport system ATPase subunit